MPPPLFTCVDIIPGSSTLGVTCEDCPLLPDCRPLMAGKRIVALMGDRARLTRQIEDQAAQNTVLLERIFRLRTDTLVTSVFTPGGMKDYLANDSEIQEEMGGGLWGVLLLDGRFVNYINRYGYEIGDRFLAASGNRITTIVDGLIRTGADRRTEVRSPAEDLRRRRDRRHEPVLRGDIICRQGGDEFSILIRNVTPEQLAVVAARIGHKLTVIDALDRYENGVVPFIASVGYAHAEEYPEVLTPLLNNDDYWGAYRVVMYAADKGQRVEKKEQYEQMWSIVVSTFRPEERLLMPTQPDDRIVAEQFLERLCPNFCANPNSYLLGRPVT